MRGREADQRGEERRINKGEGGGSIRGREGSTREGEGDPGKMREG